MHLTGTPIWCDARRRRDVCFVSSAERVGSSGHGQLIGTPLTLALLGARGAGHLAVPVHRNFTLGTLRVELIPSGRGPGAAALQVQAGERRVLYAGPVRTAGADGGEVRACDAVVVAAPFGASDRRFEPPAEVAARLASWAQDEVARGRSAVLEVDSVVDGIDVVTRLAALGVAAAGSRTLRDALARIRDVAPVPDVAAPSPRPGVIIRVPPDRVRVAAERASSALVSGRALDEPADGACFAWPSAADRAQLLAWIAQTGAREVFVTGACAEAIAAALGPRARALGPPRQMHLFPREVRARAPVGSVE